MLACLTSLFGNMSQASKLASANELCMQKSKLQVKAAELSRVNVDSGAALSSDS